MASEAEEIAEAERRRKLLMDQLAAAPLVDVTGVVSPFGAGGGALTNELWMLTVDFAAWRVANGEIQTQPLPITREVSHQELNRLMGLLQPYQIVRIKARIVDKAISGRRQALFEQFLGAERGDQELIEFSIQLQAPVTFEDATFGTFILDRRVEWFTGEVEWCGSRVLLNLSGRESPEVQRALAVAHALWQDQDSWNARICEFAVQKLLPIRNDCWLGENEAETTPDEFKNRMALDSITVYPDGDFDFMHSDGDLFWGHSIQVVGNLTKGATHADIPG